MQSFTSCCLSLQKVTDVSTFHHLHGFHPDASFYCYSLTWLSPKASWQSNQMTLSKCKLDYIHHWFGFSSSLVTFRRQQGLQSPSDTGPSQAPWLLSLFFHRSVVPHKPPDCCRFSIAQSCCDALHGPQRARLPCPSPFPGLYLLLVTLFLPTGFLVSQTLMSSYLLSLPGRPSSRYTHAFSPTLPGRPLQLYYLDLRQPTLTIGII